jgi:TetR/AcrR family transcriptional regulator of autoinduction and epiphytic fitness
MDPRIARTQKAVLDAATDLLVEGGPAALTMDAVVARSGVAKSTLYRHWETRDALVAAVFDSCAPAMEIPAESATCEEGLRALVRSLARSLSEEHWDQLAPALILLSRQHPELADLDSEMKQAQHQATEAVLRLGIDEGVLDPSVLDDVSRTIALLIGPVVFAGLTGMTPVDDDLADVCVSQFLAGQKTGGGP